ncbi:uncharacterized protein G2W53_026393 [Senna tora]|uniref:Uncharacterized protein n=1 Tax=Senna tora TaxID=362788 RepID=A0A834WHD9_9FABA|nr:uncharacterized protein G2W53_026393 [Senna tora]
MIGQIAHLPNEQDHQNDAMKSTENTDNEGKDFKHPEHNCNHMERKMTCTSWGKIPPKHRPPAKSLVDPSNDPKGL